MDTDVQTLLFAEETKRILACAMEVHNELGQGFREKTYENAMVVLFNEQGLPFEQQARFSVLFHSVKVDDFIPDLVAFGKIIVDIKTVDQLGPVEIGQMLNYLRATGLKVALLINFKHSRLAWKRVVL